jgi:PAS domain S-box-containing protein
VLVAFLVIGITTSRLSDRARREALNANQRRAEAVAAQQRFADLVNSVEGIVWEADAQTFAFSFISEQAERILGYPAEQWLREPTFWKDHLHPEDRDSAVQFCVQATAEKRSHDFEYRMIAADGRAVWLRNLVTMMGENGRASQLRGVMIDITKRKQNEQTLREREARIRRLVDANIVGIFFWDFDGGILDANDEFLRMVGYDRDDLASGRLRWTDLTPADWREQDARLVQEHRKAGRLEPFEKEYFRKDGGRVPVLVGNASFEENTNQGIAFVLDLTERKRAEEVRERLRQALADLAHVTRVTTMGELTASLAHEIKQPMAAAVTDARTCLRWLGRDEPELGEAREAAARVVKDVMLASDIISRIGLLFKKGASQHELLDVNEIIQEMIVLLRNEASRYSIAIRSELADDLPKVMADRVQLQQVLMNLLLNGIEAMKDLGPPGALTISSRRESGQLVISVSDIGVGLTPEQSGQIFNAFFTTKPQGTGMGLTISRSIVESHGGRLWATANPERGATFHFTLPTAAANVKQVATLT